MVALPVDPEDSLRRLANDADFVVYVPAGAGILFRCGTILS